MGFFFPQFEKADLIDVNTVVGTPRRFINSYCEIRYFICIVRERGHIYFQRNGGFRTITPSVRDQRAPNVKRETSENKKKTFEQTVFVDIQFDGSCK